MKKRIISFALVLLIVCTVIPFEGLAYAKAFPLPALTGDQALDTANIAKSQIGYERTDGTIYGAWWTGFTNWGYDYTNEAWCAMFACWCANQAGAGYGKAYDKNGASTSKLLQWYKDNATYDLSFSTSPRTGDFIFFGTSAGKTQHVAIVTGYNSTTKTVSYVGGNQGTKKLGQVTAETCGWWKGAMTGKQYVLGYGRPKYTTTGPHTCDKGKYVGFEAAHPHRSRYTCSVCHKEWAVDGSTNYESTCAECERPGKPVLSSPAGGTYKAGQMVRFQWYTAVSATHYNLYIDRKNQNGQWERSHNLLEVNNGMDYPFDAGEYRCMLQACNANFMEPGQPDAYLHTNGDYVYFTVTPAVCNHTFGNWQITLQATCTAEGRAERYCTACGAKQQGKIAATGHKFGSWKTTKKATCEKTGVQTKTCSGCGAKQTKTIAQKDHSYGSWKTTKKATCKKTGVKTKTCADCGAKQTKTIAKAAHSYKKGRCTVCNKKDPKANFVKIKTQPKNAVVSKGKTAKVTVKASGDGLKYTWYYAKKGSSKFKKVTSEKTKTFSVKMSSKYNGGKVYCVVKDKYGNKVKSDVVTLYQGTPAKIKTQPKSTTAVNGKTAKLTVKATGKGLKYRWYYMKKGDTKFTKSSVTKSTFSVKMSSKWNGAKVYCVVTDKYGTKIQSSEVKLTQFNAKTAAVGTWKSTYQFTPKGKVFTNTDMTVKITKGGTVTIKTAASGTGYKKGTFEYTLKYQKTKNGTVYYKLTNFWEEHTALYSVDNDRLTIRLSNGNEFYMKAK